MLNVYIVINRNEEAFNYHVDENIRDINGEPLSTEGYVNNIFLQLGYVEEVKVYKFLNGKMRLSKTYTK